jgi:hypothetical protein
LVVPLRPTRKPEFPLTPFENYISWTQTNSPVNHLSNGILHQQKNDAPISANSCNLSYDLPFDPWLRKHVRLGGNIVKIAPSSMVIEGTVAEWKDWTGVDLYDLCQNAQVRDLKIEPDSKREYLDVTFKGGLVPLKVYAREQTCTYIEPNVWLYHKL